MKHSNWICMLSAILLGTVLFTGCEKKTVTSPAAGHMYVASWEDGSSETVYLYEDGSAELIQSPVAAKSIDNTHLYWAEENNTIDVKYGENKIWRQDLWNQTIISGKFGYYDINDEELADPKGVKTPGHQYGMGIKFIYPTSKATKLYVLIQ